MNAKRTISAVLAAAIMAAFAGGACAQPAGGPSLPDTVAYIRSLVVGQGPSSFTAYFHNAQTGEDTSQTKTTAYADVQLSGDCRVEVKYHVAFNQEAGGDGGDAIDLRAINVHVMTQADLYDNQQAGAGKPFVTAEVSPSRYVVVFGSTDAGWFEMKTAEDAARLAKALQHAAALCGKSDAFAATNSFDADALRARADAQSGLLLQAVARAQIQARKAQLAAAQPPPSPRQAQQPVVAQDDPAPSVRPQVSTHCKVEVAKAFFNLGFSAVALATGHQAPQAPDVDESACDGQ